MASDAPELDLYADDIGDEFAQEYNDNDLYDDVLTSNSSTKRNNNNSSNNDDDGQQFNASNNNNNNSNQTQSNSSQNSQSNSNNNLQSNTFSSSNNNSNNSNLLVTNNQSTNETSNHYGSGSSGPVRKPCIYVGNLTWWTTDEDVIKSLNSINVNDVIEVKFFENRANGQSKGFCVVTMQSDTSVRIALEKLKQTVIHNQNPIVTLCNRQNLNNFEMKSRKPGLNGQPGGGGGGNSGNQQQNNHQQNNFMQNNRNNYNQPNPNQMQQSTHRPPLIARPMRPSGPLLNHHASHNQPRLSAMPHPSMSYGSGSNNSAGNQQSTWNHQMMSNGPRNNPMQTPGANQLNPMLRLNQGNHRQLSNQPLLSAPANQSSLDLRSQLSSVTTMAGVHNPMSSAAQAAAHALFASQSGMNLPPSTSDLFTNRMAASMGPFGPAAAAAAHSMANVFDRSAAMDAMASMNHQMSEAEFEEILNKNKNLSNNAISRAVTDAASGDYTAAIDTLSTAISLIKGSRVAHDERCKIIISTLQDTLQGMEQKSYSMSDRGSSSRSKSDHRMPRSRSRDRDDHRGSSSHRGGGRGDHKDRRGRDRSRSRDRDYRERSRDRYHEDHRSYHEDRYRDKDRDRDHGRGRH